MGILVVATDDRALEGRIETLIRAVKGARFLATGTDPAVIARVLQTRVVEALCFKPGAFAEWLELRRLSEGCVTQGWQPKQVLLVNGTNSSFVYRVLGYGIDDVIDVSVTDDDLTAGLRTLLNGQSQACRRFLNSEVDVIPKITSQQIIYSDEIDRQIVPMIATGYSDKEIAEIIHYSHQAVRNRISRILLSSGLRNRTHLAARYTLERLDGTSGGGESLVTS